MKDGQHRAIKISKVPEKTCATEQIGPYRVVLRALAHEVNGQPIYELAVWHNWTLAEKTNWSGWYNANREFHRAKRITAIELAKRVLFNEPEDQ